MVFNEHRRQKAEKRYEEERIDGMKSMVRYCVGWEVGSEYHAPQFSGLGSWIAAPLHGA